MGSARKPAPRREPNAPNGDPRLIRHDGQGRLEESDDLSRSLAQDEDVKTPAKRGAKPGQGDRGDRRLH